VGIINRKLEPYRLGDIPLAADGSRKSSSLTGQETHTWRDHLLRKPQVLLGHRAGPQASRRARGKPHPAGVPRWAARRHQAS
jgi:hypothetical protein